MTKQQYSPSTQAVSDAAEQVYWDWGNLCPASADTIAAAALRALADRIMPIEYELFDGHLQYEKSNPVRDQILSIAKELEETK